MTEWTKEWPTEPGWYWFYGQKFRGWNDDGDPQLYMVIVHKTRNGVACVVDGHFMYAQEGAWGWWQPAILPDLPED